MISCLPSFTEARSDSLLDQQDYNHKIIQDRNVIMQDRNVIMQDLNVIMQFYPLGGIIESSWSCNDVVRG